MRPDWLAVWEQVADAAGVRTRRDRPSFRDKLLVLLQDDEAALTRCLLPLPRGAAVAGRLAIARTALVPPSVAQPDLAVAVAREIASDIATVLGVHLAPDVRVAPRGAALERDTPLDAVREACSAARSRLDGELGEGAAVLAGPVRGLLGPYPLLVEYVLWPFTAVAYGAPRDPFALAPALHAVASGLFSIDGQLVVVILGEPRPS